MQIAVDDGFFGNDEKQWRTMSIQAQEKLSPVCTPLVEIRVPGWKRILIKDETQQISGAFKYRGSLHKIAQLPTRSALVTASTGNHASGLARAAALRELSLVVYVPHTTPQAKQRKITQAGAEVTIVNGDYDACEILACGYASRTGATFIHSFDDLDIITGHRSLYREIAEDAGLPDCAFIPVGGGGLVTAGIAEWGDTGVRLIGVEYEAAPAMKLSLEQRERVVLKSACGLPEGLLVRRIGQLAFRACDSYGLEVRTVSDADLHMSMRMLWEEAGIRAEAAGAAALAAALKAPESDKVAVCIVSGGNIDAATWGNCVKDVKMP